MFCLLFVAASANYVTPNFEEVCGNEKLIRFHQGVTCSPGVKPNGKCPKVHRQEHVTAEPVCLSRHCSNRCEACVLGCGNGFGSVCPVGETCTETRHGRLCLAHFDAKYGNVAAEGDGLTLAAPNAMEQKNV